MMGGTIRWCFTHNERARWADSTVCFRIELDKRHECDVADALVIRAPIDYEAATAEFVAYITALGFPVEDGWDLVNAKTATGLIVDAALGGNDE